MDTTIVKPSLKYILQEFALSLCLGILLFIFFSFIIIDKHGVSGPWLVYVTLMVVVYAITILYVFLYWYITKLVITDQGFTYTKLFILFPMKKSIDFVDIADFKLKQKREKLQIRQCTTVTFTLKNSSTKKIKLDYFNQNDEQTFITILAQKLK